MSQLPRPNLTNPCSSSSSNKDDDDIEILHNDQPILSISTATNTTSNTGRLSLLPAFPSLHQHGVVVYRNREHLLLANVPRLYPLNSYSS